MAEVIKKAPTKWIVRCRCGSTVAYRKKDVLEKIDNEYDIPVKIKYIECPECGKNVTVYFNRPYTPDE